MAKLKEQISIKTPSIEFEEILMNPNNPRIIFSGIFGSGKTTFIKTFFEKNHDKFVRIHLFPVNYVSNQNEDIFELIKFDILYELLDKPNLNLESLDLSYLDAIPFAIGNLGIESLTQFIELIPKFGKPISEIIKPLFELDKLIRAKKKDIETTSNEGKAIEAFALQIFNKKGHAYEFDLYTKLIQELIKRVKESDPLSDKSSVLVVDDLDRIDPDNIFRLLNVFSAHFDLKGDSNENKFGFDKIIFCCDIDNIRKIFQHRFGLDVDFNGYIDKFYSEVYEYDNGAEVKKIIEDVMRTVTLPNGRLWKKGRSNIEDASFEITTTLIEYMIDSKVFNLRKLINLNEAIILERQYYLNIRGHEYEEKVNLRLFTIFDFLIKLLGNYEAVLNAFKRTIFPINMKDWIKENLIGESILIIDKKFNSLRTKANISYSKQPELIYNIYQERSHHGIVTSAKIQGYDSMKHYLNINEFLSESFTTYSQLRGAMIH